MGYLTNFIVYTLAMVGVMVLALMVFKNATSGGHKKNTKFLKVLDTMSLGPRKTLYIVSAGNEKFLIAGDVDKTTLISKLHPNATENEENTALTMPELKPKSFKETMNSIPSKSLYMDKSRITHSSVMKNLAEKMRDERSNIVLSGGGNE